MPTFDAWVTPFDAWVTPFDAWVTPFDTRVAPFDTRVAPFDTRVAPFDLWVVGALLDISWEDDLVVGGAIFISDKFPRQTAWVCSDLGVTIVLEGKE